MISNALVDSARQLLDLCRDRKLKIVGSVLGVALLGVIGWIGFDYVGGQDISAELIKSDVVSDDRVEAHLEVRKDRDAAGYKLRR